MNTFRSDATIDQSHFYLSNFVLALHIYVFLYKNMWSGYLEPTDCQFQRGGWCTGGLFVFYIFVLVLDVFTAWSRIYICTSIPLDHRAWSPTLKRWKVSVKVQKNKKKRQKKKKSYRRNPTKKTDWRKKNWKMRKPVGYHEGNLFFSVISKSMSIFWINFSGCKSIYERL